MLDPGARETQPPACARPAEEPVTNAICVDHVSKEFRLYQERNQSLKAAVMRRGRARYEDLLALDDVSLEIPAGSTFGLIGRNGSGKSTLLKCMARILRPDRGTITVDGKLSALLELGAGFHPELSGRENVYLNGSILGLTKKDLDRRFDEIVAFAGLARFIDTPVKNYSSGMYVRLGFSVAINVDPDVLLVDEVLAVGDETFQRKCNEKFSELRAAGKTIVLVSHGLGPLRSLCDQAAWLDGGELRAVGDAAEVIDDYIGESHGDRQTSDSGQGSRWGSGEGRIERIELLDAEDRPVTNVRSGSPVTLRFSWSTSQPLSKAVIGLAIHNLEGVLVTGCNTRETAALPQVVEGRGHVDYRIDSLALLPDAYDVTASFTDETFLHPYDFCYRTFRFDVEPAHVKDVLSGIVWFQGSWHAESAQPVRR
ncbi:MAG: ABC transporter ATP-binding protein [Acidimicrobiales bacterium]